MPQRDRAAELAEYFRLFAVQECGDLPVYRRLNLGAADDPELLDLMVERIPQGQRRPNLILAAVHHLLLQGTDGEIGRWYPTVNGGLAPPDVEVDDPYPAFHRFVFEHLDELDPLLRTGATQTNEVNRSCLWFAALRSAAADLPDRQIAFVEIGTSAGLNQLFDRYAYDYGDGVVRGDAGSPVRLASELVGHGAPIDAPLPAVVHRVGIDLDPIDVRDPVAASWLRACVWPEQLDRHARLAAALELAAAHPPMIVAGDALDELADVVEDCPDDAHVVVVNSWVLVYIQRERREALGTLIDTLGASRPLTWLSAEHPTCLARYADPDPAASTLSRTLVGMTRWRDGVQDLSVPAMVHPHLRWLEWRSGE